MYVLDTYFKTYIYIPNLHIGFSAHVTVLEDVSNCYFLFNIFFFCITVLQILFAKLNNREGNDYFHPLT